MKSPKRVLCLWSDRSEAEVGRAATASGAGGRPPSAECGLTVWLGFFRISTSTFASFSEHAP